MNRAQAEALLEYIRAVALEMESEHIACYHPSPTTAKEPMPMWPRERRHKAGEAFLATVDEPPAPLTEEERAAALAKMTRLMNGDWNTAPDDVVDKWLKRWRHG